MTAVRMALSELRRLTAGRLPKLAVVALLCVPMLYGGLYLYANHDPYGRLNQVPTAVVVEDTGTTLSTGEKLAVGPQVADELVKSKSFDWHRVDRAEATAGVSDGQVRVRAGAAEDVLGGSRVQRGVHAAAGEARADHQRREQLPRAHDREPGRRAGDQDRRGAGERDRGEQAAGRVQHDPRADQPGGDRRRAAAERPDLGEHRRRSSCRPVRRSSTTRRSSSRPERPSCRPDWRPRARAPASWPPAPAS